MGYAGTEEKSVGLKCPFVTGIIWQVFFSSFFIYLKC